MTDLDKKSSNSNDLFNESTFKPVNKDEINEIEEAFRFDHGDIDIDSYDDDNDIYGDDICGENLTSMAFEETFDRAEALLEMEEKIFNNMVDARGKTSMNTTYEPEKKINESKDDKSKKKRRKFRFKTHEQTPILQLLVNSLRTKAQTRTMKYGK